MDGRIYAALGGQLKYVGTMKVMMGINLYICLGSLFQHNQPQPQVIPKNISMLGG